MRACVTLIRRELASYFFSMTGYVIIATATFLVGLSFVVLLAQLQASATPMPLTQIFFSTAYFWIILLIATPIITMRLFALEKFSGTFETLMTTPVSDLQVVLAKFFSAMIFYLLMWLPLLACVLVVHRFSNDPRALDAGILGSTFLGIALVGALFIAIGCFASSLTRSQIIAAMLSFAAGISLFLLSFLGEQFSPNSTWQMALVSYVMMFDHMRDFARGVVDTRAVTFYLTLTFFFLFLTLRVIESRRWK
jgi:ABC-2 type transport system permease protein